MSNTIDNRVVSLEFDNSRFERNVRESMSTLDKLKEKLHFKGATKGIEEVEAASNRLTFGPLGQAVDYIGGKFSWLEQMAVGALRNIGVRAEQSAEKLVRSLTTDQLVEGWNKYNDKTESVQLIMNATGESIEDVNKQLEKLNWFTDETSYNFTDMVANVGKFTNNKIPLDEAVDAMQGIATWAGLSGANVQEASRAMYNMSQAIGVGSVKLMDWKSIENANMATAEFKETALKTAVALGKLRDAGNGVYKTIGKGTEVTVQNFNEALSEGWFDKDVLMKTLNQYGGFATKLRAAIDKLGADSASDALGLLDEFRKGTLDLNKLSVKTGTSVDELKESLDELAASEMNLGERAFRASQEAKTFKEAIDATKDAVSTGWMTTFEHIFGNYEEAKVLWTDLANGLWDVFASGAEARNEMMAIWHEAPGGRPALIEAFWNAFNGLKDVLQTVKDAFNEIFPSEADERAKNLIAFTTKLRDLSEKFKMSDETAEKLKNTFKGVAAVFHIFKEAVSALVVFIKPLIDLLGKLKNRMLGGSSGFGEFAVKLDKVITETKLFRNIFEAVVSFVEKAVEKLKSAFKNFTGLSLSDEFTKLGDKITGVTQKFGNAMAALTAPKKGIKSALEAIEKGADQAHGAVFDLVSVVEDSKVTLEGWKKIENAGEATAELKQEMMDAAVAAGTLKKEEDGVYKTLEGNEVTLEEFDSTLKDNWATTEVLAKATEKLGTANETAEKKSTGFRKLLDGFKAVGEKLSPIFKSLGEIAGKVFAALGDRLKQFADGLDASGISKLVSSGAFAALAASIIKFLKSTEKAKEGAGILKDIGGAITGFFKGSLQNVTGFFSNINGIIKNFGTLFEGLGNTMKEFQKQMKTKELLNVAIAVGILTLSILLLSRIEPDKIAAALAAVTAEVAEMVGVLVVLSKTSTGADFTGLKKLAVSLVIFAVAVYVLSAALKKLAALDPEKLVVGLVGLGALSSMLVGMGLAIVGISKILSSESATMVKAAFSLILFAIAIGLLVKPLKKIGEMSVEGLLKGVVGLYAIIMELVLISVVLSRVKIGIGNAFSLILLATALNLIVRPLQKFGEMDVTQIAKGLAAMAGALVILTAISALLSAFSGGKTLVGAISLLLMALTLNLIVKPLIALSEIPWANLIKSLIVMTEALVILALVPALLGMFGPMSLVGALTMLMMAITLRLIADPLKSLGEMDWGQMARALISMTVALLVLGAIPALMSVFAPASILGVFSLLLMTKVLEEIVEPLKALGEMDWGQMWRSIIALTLTLTAMALIPSVFAVFTPAILIGARAFLGMTEVLKEIVAPLRVLGRMSWDQMWISVIALSLTLAAMAVIPSIFAVFTPAILVGAHALLEMTKVLDAIVVPLRSLGEMDWDQMWRAVVALTLTLAAMALIPAIFAVFTPAILIGARGLLDVANVLAIAADPIKTLGEMSWGDIARSITAMSAALIAMSVVAAAVGVFSALSAVGADGLAKTAVALTVAVIPLKMLATMSWSEIGRGLTAMTAVLAVLSAAMIGFNPFAKLKAEGFSAMAMALRNIVDPLKSLGKINWDDLQHSLEAMRTIFSALADVTSGTKFADLFSGARAKSFESLANSLKALAPALAIISRLDQEAVKTALDSISKAFSDFGEALNGSPWFMAKSRAQGIGALIDNISGLTENLPGFMELDADAVKVAFTTLGEGFKSFGEALDATPWFGSKSRAEGIGALLDNIEPLTTVLPAFMELDIEKVSTSMETLGGGFQKLGEALKASPFWGAGDRAEAMATVVASTKDLVSVIKDYFRIYKTKEEIAGASEVLSSFIISLSTAMKEFSVSGDKTSNLAKILEALGTEVPKLIPALQSIQKLDTNALFTKLRLSAQAVNEFASNLTDLEISFENFEENAVAAGQAFVDTFTKTVNDGKAQVRVAGSNVALAASYGARGQYDAFVKAGKYLMSGLQLGIENGAPKVANAAGTVVRNARFQAEDEGQIKSPSKVFARIGQFLDLGLVAGLERYSYKVSTASSDVVKDAIDAANEPFSKFGDIFGDDMRATMTITPVLDLSEIQNDRAMLANSLNGIGIGTSVHLADQNAAGMARRASLADRQDASMEKLTGLIRDLVDNPPSVNNNEFNITNGDPEEVADAVERRLTRDIVRRNAVWGR